MTRYVFEHPAEAGLGEHHADPSDPPLSERPADRFGTSAPMTGLAPGEVTMADLDMPHGTVVELDVVDEPGHPDEGKDMPPDPDTGQVFVRWEDAQGNPRRTAIPQDTFNDFFREVE